MSSIVTLLSRQTTSPARGEHQRVDLDQRRVAVAVEPPERAHDAGQRLPRRRAAAAGALGVERGRGHDVAHLVVAEAEQRVDRACARARRVAPRDLLDVDAALGGEDRAAGRAARARTTIARYSSRSIVDGLLDEHARDARVRGCVMPRISAAAAATSSARGADADAAGLAAAAGLDLRLDDHRQAELAGRRPRLRRRRTPARRQDRQPGLREQLLALMLEQVHAVRLRAARRRRRQLRLRRQSPPSRKASTLSSRKRSGTRLHDGLPRPPSAGSMPVISTSAPSGDDVGDHGLLAELLGRGLRERQAAQVAARQARRRARPARSRRRAARRAACPPAYLS